MIRRLLPQFLWIAALALNAIALLPWLLFIDRDLRWTGLVEKWYGQRTGHWPSSLAVGEIASIFSIWLVGVTLLGLCFLMHPRWGRIAAWFAIVPSAVLTLPLLVSTGEWFIILVDDFSLFHAPLAVWFAILFLVLLLPVLTVPPFTFASVLLIARWRGTTPLSERRPETCPKCGYLIGPAEWSFCPECGAPRPARVSEPRIWRFARIALFIALGAAIGLNVGYVLLAWLIRWVKAM